ncbi:MAG: Rieske 2Fe-2S domain-containing protein [Nitrososphaeraceae archaeon]
MAEWVKVCDSKSLKSGEMLDFDLNDKKILLININNNIYASDRICTHAYADLSTGFLNENEKTVTCPLHMSVFDLQNGNPLNLPAEVPLKIYKTKKEHNSIFVLL